MPTERHQNTLVMQWRWTPLRTGSAPCRVAVPVNSGMEKLRVAAGSPTAFPVMAALWMRAVAEFLEPNDESSGNDPGATDVLVLSKTRSHNADQKLTPLLLKVSHNHTFDSAWIKAAVGAIWTAQEHAWVSASTPLDMDLPAMIEINDDETLPRTVDDAGKNNEGFLLHIHLLPNGTATVSGCGAHWGSEARLHALVQAYGTAIEAAANPRW